MLVMLFRMTAILDFASAVNKTIKPSVEKKKKKKKKSDEYEKIAESYITEIHRH